MAVLILWLMIGVAQEAEVASQDIPMPQAIIDRYIEAKGGRETLAKVENVVIKGDMIVGDETIGTFATYQAPHQQLAVETFADGSQRSRGTNGKIAWQIDVDGSPSILTGQVARDYIRHSSSLHEALEWPKHSRAIEYKGKETIDEVLVHHLLFTAHDGQMIHRYFEVASGLYVREQQTLAEANGARLVTKISDYFPDETGNLVARRRVLHFGSAYTMEYRVHTIEANRITDFSIFALPASVAQLQSQHDADDAGKAE